MPVSSINTNADLILKNGIAVLPGITTQADIAVKAGKIVAIGDVSGIKAEETIDCTGLHILPGLIDTQVHFREPGADHKEVLETGMKAAAMGGITTVFEMPNTNPLTTTPETIADKLSRAAKNPWVNHAFYLGGTAQNAANLGEWEKLDGVCGIKIFMGASTGDLLSATDEEVEAVLAHGRRVVAVHAEDEMMMNENKKTILGDSHDVLLHPVWRSAESCLSATTRLVRLARKHMRRVHVLHITTAQEMEFLALNKDIASVEVLANHLTLHAPECYERLGSKAQQNPPIREKNHQDALWKAISDGTVDIVASDHAPHTLEEKANEYPASPSGTPGVQTLVPIMLNHINEGRLTIEKLVELMCYGPQRIHRIVGKGRLARGYDADFTIIDVKKKQTITNAQQLSRTAWTPFDGMEVTGWPVITIVNGKIVARNGQLGDGQAGQMVKFEENAKSF
ncbi:MAG: dihydroorotase [Alphaproteobacteria bacterium]|nr:dihydroorotase [Alphaproteobacteria bacterium]MCB9985680.1 dihydroorotase [Micavibrio sp.]HRK97691.1 dihydroorotase [Alphaproteobacteria bacterium]